MNLPNVFCLITQCDFKLSSGKISCLFIYLSLWDIIKQLESILRKNNNNNGNKPSQRSSIRNLAIFFGIYLSIRKKNGKTLLLFLFNLSKYRKLQNKGTWWKTRLYGSCVYFYAAERRSLFLHPPPLLSFLPALLSASQWAQPWLWCLSSFSSEEKVSHCQKI